jgi:hypothetical protein
VLAKVPTAAQAKVKAACWQLFDDLDFHLGRPPSRRLTAAPRRSPSATSTPTWRRAVRCRLDPCPCRPCTCGSPPSTAGGFATPTCCGLVERTFGRPTSRPRSSAGCLASGPACGWSGPCWTGASRGWRGRPTPGRHPAVPRPRRQLLYPCSSPEVIDPACHARRRTCPPGTRPLHHHRERHPPSLRSFCCLPSRLALVMVMSSVRAEDLSRPSRTASAQGGRNVERSSPDRASTDGSLLAPVGATRRSRSCFAEATRATAPRDRLQPISASPKPPGGAGARLAVYAPPDQQRPLS